MIEKEIHCSCLNKMKEISSQTAIVSGEIGECFEAHGISNGSVWKQYQLLINLLEKGIDPTRSFYTAPFSLQPQNILLDLAYGGCQNGCVKNGIAVLVSAPFKKLTEGIQTVFINDYMSFLIKPLSKKYHSVAFYRLSENIEVLTEKLGKKRSELFFTPELFLCITLEKYKENCKGSR